MRSRIAAAVVALTVAGCGGTSDGSGGKPRATAERTAAPRSLVEKCTERVLERIPQAERQAARHYVEATYCSRFAERGWVYDDGALSIEAHKWLEAGGKEECIEPVAEGEPAKPARTVPCEKFDEQGKVIRDCALLHYVRRNEVEHYIAELRRRHGDVECEDGTPLSGLGAP